MMNQLLFVRHGESEANQLEICAGHTNVKLTDLGRRQALQAGTELRASGQPVDVIVSSPLLRTLETAQIIASILSYPTGKIVISRLAIERYRGDLEGQPSYLQDGMSDGDYAKHGAESGEELTHRAEQLIGYLDSQFEGTVLLVSHNQLGKRLIASRRGSSVAEVTKIPNARVFSI